MSKEKIREHHHEQHHEHHHEHHHHHEGGHGDIIKVIVAAVLLAAAMLSNHFFLASAKTTELDASLGATSTIAIILFLAAYVVAGAETIKEAVEGIINGELLDENFLMVVASVGALILGDYAEGVAVMLFFQVGELFEHYAEEQSRQSISELMDLRPDYANLYDPATGRAQTVDPKEVAIGDIIQVNPGEKVPLDGQIVRGASSVQTAALTGEALPRNLETGDQILSGFVNISEPLLVKVSSVLEESTAAKVLRLVEDAAENKAQAEKFVTKFARIYTPAVVGAAAVLALIPPIFAGGDFSTWIYRALMFLVISCPCALVISIPLSFFGGIGAASRAGILVKGSNYLEALGRVGAVVFDKTGTLTTGYVEGKTVMGDELKADAKETISGLREMGVKQINVLTGDKRENAEKLAEQIGLSKENVFSELLPSDKLEKVELLLAELHGSEANQTLVYVGDGINDAPSLVRADVGIAMGGLGSDAAIEAADVAIMTDEPSKLITLVGIAKKTLKIAKENIIFALGVKALILVLGAVGIATMWAAVFADVGVTVIAVLNSLRALR